MKKAFKVLLTVFILIIILGGFYLYELHALAVEANQIFEQRCLKVNPPLIGYKNSFLKIADGLKNKGKYTKDEMRTFLDDYLNGIKAYIPVETKWLETQRKYLDRWDFQHIEPDYLKKAGEYQWKMYEARRDDAQYMLDLFNNKSTSEPFNGNYPEPRQRGDKYSQLFWEEVDKSLKISDWRKIFGYLPLPEGCNKENLTIPNTSGSLGY